MLLATMHSCIQKFFRLCVFWLCVFVILVFRGRPTGFSQSLFSTLNIARRKLIPISLPLPILYQFFQIKKYHLHIASASWNQSPLLTLYIIMFRPSATSVNINGDKGSPSFKPLVYVIFLPTSSFMSTLIFLNSSHSFVQDFHLLPNSIISNIFIMHFQPTESYFFEIKFQQELIYISVFWFGGLSIALRQFFREYSCL